MYSPPLTRSKARILKRKSLPSNTIMNQQHEEVLKKVENVEEVVISTKKIKLSQDEKHLSGAPEGDIYDITVLSDENLCPLANPNSEWNTVVAMLTSNISTWAEKHTAIETIRKISVHHQELLNGDQMLLAISEATKATGSLRSCICRNGILCLQSLYRLPFFTALICGPNADSFIESISVLMNKSVNGPKFICSVALTALEIGVERTPISLLYSTLHSLTLHKNAEIVNRSFVFIAQQSRKLKSALSRESDEVIVDILQLIDRGIDSPRPAGREASKKALECVISFLGVSRVQIILDKSVCDEDRKTRIFRVVRSIQGDCGSASSCFSPKTGKPTIVKPKSQVKAPKPPPRASFKDHIKMLKTQQRQHEDVSAPSTNGGSDSTSLDSVHLII